MRDALTNDESQWLRECFASIPDSVDDLTPSEWAELKRYLPPSATSLPGIYRYDVAPYLREIVDCLGIDSPVHEVVLMKGAQVGATVGLIENAIGYLIDHVKTAPALFITASADLAALRMTSYITPMLQASNLLHLIKSSDEKNPRKTGKSDKKLEWEGGGFLLPLSARSAGNLRSVSARYIFRDEIDAWADSVGKDGDPLDLSAARAAAFEGTRKILDASTPLLKGTSKVLKRYQLGDQRKYFVCCLKCSYPQVLRWRTTNPETGVLSGLVWDLDSAGNLVVDSVRYLCQSCQHPHINDDKTRLLDPDYGAEWRPTAVASMPDIRSYHLSALYSPVGMQTWETCVRRWLEAWDTEANRVKDREKLQVFYNNILGEPWEVQGGNRIKFERVSSHRRVEYESGVVPNRFAVQHCGSPVLLLTCTVDVHRESLNVAVFGWCRDQRVCLIEYTTLEGETERPDAPVWGQLRDVFEDRSFESDDGKKYQVDLVFIDSGYNADAVYSFCDEYPSGVYPVKGRETPTKAAYFREFSLFTTPLGKRAYMVTVDHYKERWHAALSQQWSGQDVQPEVFFNAPRDITDRQLKELTAESKVEKKDRLTGRTLGWEWYRPNGAPNELWDLLVYANAALDVYAQDYCEHERNIDYVDWNAFYEHQLGVVNSR